jgi:hypothetical protein
MLDRPTCDAVGVFGVVDCVASVDTATTVSSQLTGRESAHSFLGLCMQAVPSLVVHLQMLLDLRLPLALVLRLSLDSVIVHNDRNRHRTRSSLLLLVRLL